MASQIHNHSTFKDFDIQNIVYKTVGSHEIYLSLLIPKTLLTSEHASHEKIPLIAQFHGGFLIGGARLYSPWLPTWLFELATSEQAIIVAPDYRLLPESNGLDILSDLASFWSWVEQKLWSTLRRLYPSSKIQPDFDRILVSGQSAGGYLAAQSMLLHPEIDIKAVAMAYPMVDLRDRHWSEKYEKSIFGVSNLPEDIIEQHLAQLPHGPIVTSDGVLMKNEESTRAPLALCIVQNGKYLDYLGRQSKLYPMENLARATKSPRFLWVYHGKGDSAVPIAGTERFLRELRKHMPEVTVKFEACEGEHGFDNDISPEVDVDWIRTGVAELRKFW
ncbi:hypothetical protein N7462_003394 [Penicillium macrosclerotiorum]|uniref:uncharacterized protein n=1 Tax=Penicillium macrosclerotiorum TaxID=303699 RepID=UPI002548C349|nr:uncharacterized protein N7462_003394 [Penicillium macrosclerotiorum]KAJ5689002.1 hypothetical protein N7462_003394 [Penicillium macrosclerotiorum]